MLPPCTLTIYKTCYSLDHHIHIKKLILSLRFTSWIVLYPPLLSSAAAPAGYPNKNSNNRKNRKRVGADGKREKAGAVFSLPIMPRALSFSFSTASLLHKKASVEERTTSLPANTLALHNEAGHSLV